MLFSPQAKNQFAIRNRRKMQSKDVFCSGESGAGKTENTKKILEYLGFCGGRSYGFNDVRMDERLTAANNLIESFANASTIHNSNSSRVVSILNSLAFAAAFFNLSLRSS